MELPPSLGPGPWGLKHRDQTLLSPLPWPPASPAPTAPSRPSSCLQGLHPVCWWAGERWVSGPPVPEVTSSLPSSPMAVPGPSSISQCPPPFFWKTHMAGHPSHRSGVACKAPASCLLSRPDGRPGRGLAPRGPGGTAWIALLSQLIYRRDFSSWRGNTRGAACLRPRGQCCGGGAQSSAQRQPLLSQVSPVRSSLWGRTRSSSSFRPARRPGEKRCSADRERGPTALPRPSTLPHPGASFIPSTRPSALLPSPTLMPDRRLLPGCKYPDWSLTSWLPASPPGWPLATPPALNSVSVDAGGREGALQVAL